MITGDLDNPIVLKRLLLELEGRLLDMPSPISAIQKVDTATGYSLETKLNEVIDTVNAIAKTLNQSRKNSF